MDAERAKSNGSACFGAVEQLLNSSTDIRINNLFMAGSFLSQLTENSGIIERCSTIASLELHFLPRVDRVGWSHCGQIN